MKRAILPGLILAICIPALAAGAGYYDCRGVVANGAVGTAGGWYEAVAAVGQSAVGLSSGYYILGSGLWQQSGGVYAGLPEVLNPVPWEFWLGSSQPNPLRTSGLVRFGVARASRVIVKVYDSRGREVATLFDGDLGPGYHAVTMDGGSLASGVYFCRMAAESGKFCETRKILVVK